MRLPRRVLAGAGALAIDAALGEPPPLHPVVGIGNLLAALRRCARAESPAGQLAEGAAGLTAVVAASALTAVAAQRLLRRLPPGGALIGEASTLSTLSRPARHCGVAVEGVRDALEAGDLDDARTRAARDLVSRDTSQLESERDCRAAIQSLAENLTDSVVAPLLAYAVGGLPAAAAYRALNTADAMWGYRTPECLHHGRRRPAPTTSSTYLPARVTALLHRARAPAAPRGVAERTARPRPRPSPNGGWPMAAMAGGLGVRLAKRGSYSSTRLRANPTRRTSAARWGWSVGTS